MTFAAVRLTRRIRFFIRAVFLLSSGKHEDLRASGPAAVAALLAFAVISFVAPSSRAETVSADVHERIEIFDLLPNFQTPGAAISRPATERLSDPLPGSATPGLKQKSRTASVASGPLSPPPPPPRKIDDLWIGLDHESFLERTHPPAGISDYTFVSGRLRTRAENHPINGAIDVGGSFATSIENYSFVEVPEAYLDWESADRDIDVTVGRRRKMWSALDEEWGFGLWQPVNRFDALHPTEQGLTGLFVDLKGRGAQLTFFVSPLYLPEQGAPYQLSDGRFMTSSPWFSAPPDSVILFPGHPVSRLNFDIQTPSVGSVINQQSYGMMFRAGSLARGEAGAFMQAAFMRKPRNSLSTPFATTLQLTDTETYGDVVIHPKLEMQTLEGFELGYRTADFAVGFSALRDDPIQTTTDYGDENARITYEVLKPALYFSPSIEWLAFKSESWAPRVKLMYLNTAGGESNADGLLSGSNSVFGSRTPYRRALSLQESSMLWTHANWRLDQSLRWIEETSENGTVLMVNAMLSYTANWRFALAADLLGSRQPESQTNDFIARFRDNDNVSAHLTYIF